MYGLYIPEVQYNAFFSMYMNYLKTIATKDEVFHTVSQRCVHATSKWCCFRD